MEALATPLPPKSTLLEYEVIKALGRGGFGTTYLCQDTNLQKKVVLKEFSPHHIVERDRRGDLKAKRWALRSAFALGKAKFLDEARRLAKFNHPNIVRVGRFFEAHNTAYFTMEHEAGGSLRSLLRAKPDVFTEKEIEAILVPLCKGLAELHKVGLIHRDIKPDNVIIRPDGSPALIDFGAAIEFTQRLPEHELEVIATPRYAPAEQFDPRGAQGPWTDIYALGATIYELIVGVPPPSSLHRAIQDKLVPVSDSARGKYGTKLLGLVDKCLAMNPLARPKDTKEFLILLQLSDDTLLESIIRDTSFKLTNHFLNWATPNDGLYCDEFIAFAICLPILDLSWRIGEGTPTKDTFLRLYRLMHADILDSCRQLMTDKGFRNFKRNLTLHVIHSRLDEYAATYLLDRQAEEWTFEMTARQLARNCLSSPTTKDLEGFVEIMRDVIDRARGRVKKEFDKAFRKIVWRRVADEWVMEIQHFG